MNSQDFRKNHLLTILHGFDQQNLPLDLFLMEYCRFHKALGAKDRKFIADTIYGLIRWRGLLDYLVGHDASWEECLNFYQEFSPNDYLDKQEIPLHIRCSFPESLFSLLVKHYGEEQAFELALISNTPAPTTVRVNALKTTREDLLARWKDLYQVKPCQIAPLGINFLQKINFRALDEFREGLFEVQDEGSQLVADEVKVKPGDTVLDFCAGAGGKALAIAPQMQQRGQLYLHDVRADALLEARKRLRRAGVQNSQVISDRAPHLQKLKKSCDWVIVDTPCSGTGTLRRNPDMKWRFQAEWVTRLQGQQRVIFERALSYVKRGGRIVYATCSLLAEENEAQAEHFARIKGLTLENTFKSLPTEGGMDGFYGVTFVKE
ncbi:MAG: RsmB/NOP family class I SAM-dependent RNA methyltransferase [Chlamydiales bacterium]|nr:RsmB/NOP family class I SAM-dependent RNA methyltransferase [Chlamydiales bacterium]